MPTEIAPKIWGILNSLTIDAQNAAKAKCTELGFDPNKGEIPLDEAFINLTSCVNVLSDAIKEQKLIQFPLTIQKEFLAQVEQVSKHLVALTGGADEVTNLVESIESLNTAIWHHRLNSISKGVLGFEAKLNQLKHQEVLLNKLNESLQSGLSTKDVLIELLEKVKAAQTESTSAAEETRTAADQATKTAEDISALSLNAATKTTATEEHEAAAEKHASSSRASLAEIEAIEGKIKEFYDEVDGYRKKITSTGEDAGKVVESNKVKTAELITELAALEKQIQKQIQEATGFSLFHSFQTRQGFIVLAKNRWAWALLALLVLSLAFTVFLVQTIGTGELSVAFFLKLSISIPIIGAITFCTLQYSRERRLEEEYAFKSAISISLDPYQKLVSGLINQESADERKQFATFILDSIQRVFTSPTEKIFDPKEKEKIKFEKTLKQIAEIVGSLNKAARP
jgi:hypothetical protein